MKLKRFESLYFIVLIFASLILIITSSLSFSSNKEHSLFIGLEYSNPSAKLETSQEKEVDVPTDSFQLFREIVDKSYRYHIDTFSFPEKFNETLEKVQKYLYEVEHIKVDLPKIPEDTPRHQALDYMEQIYESLWKNMSTHNVKFSKKKLLLLFIRAFCYSLDPYTDYMGPKAYSEFLEAMRGGDFTGIGVYIGKPKDKKYILILEPVEGTPAYRAGLKSGDLIIAINGRDTEDMSLELAQALIRGPKGTKVVLTIKRGDKIFDVTIIRDFIHVNSVKYELMKCPDGKKIAYLKVRFFGENTSREFDEKFQEVEADKPQAIVIDLRYNSGGLMDAAVDLVSHFIPGGRLVVSLHTRMGNRKYKKPFYSRSKMKRDLRTPLYVLINRYTASASEITAQALKDYHRAKILGEPSFGKNTVQTLYPISFGGSLKLTIGRYFTPSGIDIAKEKVQPDVVIKGNQNPWVIEEKDLQLRKAIEFICRDINK